MIAYTHSGHSLSVRYGFTCLFVIGFLWAALGGGAVALPALLNRERLTEFFPPLIAIFLAWFVRDIAVDHLIHVDSAYRQNDPLYWYDTSWTSALVAVLAGSGKITIVANGRLTVPALFATALDERIESVYLSGGLVSMRSVARSETYKCPLANIVPNLLAVADLPELAGAIEPRTVHLAGCVDARGKKMDSELVRRAYPYTNVKVSEDPEWTPEKLFASYS